MNVEDLIDTFLTSQPEIKGVELKMLHETILRLFPSCKLWFLDGKNHAGKTVSNPNIGYGSRTMKYSDGKTKEFYQVGISPNTKGISIYILGIEDTSYLREKYGNAIGKASVSGYCISFKSIKDINIPTLEAALLDGFGQISNH